QGRAVVDRPADPVAKNARTHTDAQVAAIAASIKEWGWTTPPRLPRGDVGQVRVVVPSDRPVRVGATMQTLAAQGRSFPPPHAGASANTSPLSRARAR